jgi:hypothetical protein
MSNPKTNPKPNPPEEMDRADQYGVLLKFKERDTVDLQAIENTLHLSKKQGAAMVKNLASNPRIYAMLGGSGFKESLISGWVARPQQGSAEQGRSPQSIAPAVSTQPAQSTLSALVCASLRRLHLIVPRCS